MLYRKWRSETLEKAGNILNQFLNTLLQKNREGEDYYHFFNKWEYIVGKRLYGHTKIIDLKNKSLFIAVDHPGWLQMVKLREKIIIKNVQKMFPQLIIKSMKISVRQECFKEERNLDEQKQIEHEKIEKNDNVEKNLVNFNEIKDEQLQNNLKRLYISIIKKEEES
ncbi:MAG: DUF721 domain-containing protein [Spirochaetales bacterium]|nr:DUF721 domain-containing protein [Spirochaetales bacterium]